MQCFDKRGRNGVRNPGLVEGGESHSFLGKKFIVSCTFLVSSLHFDHLKVQSIPKYRPFPGAKNVSLSLSEPK